ncbi:MAG: RecX family transcriptional regulator [Clostridia bacterium]|nr:RecX family transcriptional regulator [Clostridia bacterium]
MKLSVKQGKANKIHIYVDEEYRATVDSDYWYSEKYRNLKEINEEELTELLDSVSFRRAYNKGLDFLSRRPFGTKELIKKLCEKGHEKEASQKACERLIELGLLNDEEYARILANDLLERKSYSIKRIKQELAFRGIDREIVENTVDSLDNDPQKSIIILVKKKYINKLSDEKGKKRTVDALLRLGYSYSDIKSALNTISEFDGEDFYD